MEKSGTVTEELLGEKFSGTELKAWIKKNSTIFAKLYLFGAKTAEKDGPNLRIFLFILSLKI